QITRSVLCRLNDRHDAALAPRREIIKRVSEFEDFSTCWESDQLKVRGLVSQVRQVVNVKDSFTRMNLEREKERAAHRAAAEAEMRGRQRKREEIDQVKRHSRSQPGGNRHRLQGHRVQGEVEV